MNIVQRQGRYRNTRSFRPERAAILCTGPAPGASSRIRYLLDTAVFFRNQLETCQAAGNAEAAQSAYLSLSSGRIGIANGVRSLKPLLLELEHPAASICEALVDQISSFELMTRDYSKFSGGISRFLDTLPSYPYR